MSGKVTNKAQPLRQRKPNISTASTFVIFRKIQIFIYSQLKSFTNEIEQLQVFGISAEELVNIKAS
jgi:hypothetical protein